MVLGRSYCDKTLNRISAIVSKNMGFGFSDEHATTVLYRASYCSPACDEGSSEVALAFPSPRNNILLSDKNFCSISSPTESFFPLTSIVGSPANKVERCFERDTADFCIFSLMLPVSTPFASSCAESPRSISMAATFLGIDSIFPSFVKFLYRNDALRSMRDVIIATTFDSPKSFSQRLPDSMRLALRGYALVDTLRRLQSSTYMPSTAAIFSMVEE